MDATYINNGLGFRVHVAQEQWFKWQTTKWVIRFERKREHRNLDKENTYLVYILGY